ncbi:MAG: hypothetical protein V4721_02760 [Bacteroidota bacterium]
MKNLLFIAIFLICSSTAESQVKNHKAKGPAIPVMLQVQAENGFVIEKIHQSAYLKKFAEILRKNEDVNFVNTTNWDEARIVVNLTLTNAEYYCRIRPSTDIQEVRFEAAREAPQSGNMLNSISQMRTITSNEGNAEFQVSLVVKNDDPVILTRILKSNGPNPITNDRQPLLADWIHSLTMGAIEDVSHDIKKLYDSLGATASK